MRTLVIVCTTLWIFAPSGQGQEPATPSALLKEFQNPSRTYQPWVFWWWLNGNASKEGITRDFEEMKRKGIGSAVLFDAGEADTKIVPRGSAFMGEGWRELFRHAVREADRCGIALSVNVCSGWNAGGPWVRPEHATKKLVAERTTGTSTGHLSVVIPKPAGHFYNDIAVLAQKLDGNDPSVAIEWDPEKALDVKAFMNAEGKLEWDAPEGLWHLVRIGYVLGGNNTQNPGSGRIGSEADPLSAEAMDVHFANTGAKLVEDAGPLVGKTLQYLQIDSWELAAQPTWTPKMREEFQRRRGYDPLKWLPAAVGFKMRDANGADAFLADYRRTVADLIAQNYYGRLSDLAVKSGMLGTHCEAAGPRFGHWIDALECLGRSDVPMGEFWTRNSEPDGSIYYSKYNPTVRMAANAAHIYGRAVCQAEAFTSIADDFIESPWSLKDTGDAAFCEGLTRMVFHGWSSQSRPEHLPGYWWEHVGTHISYKLTWWPLAEGWLSYLSRCQLMLRQGTFAADIAYLQSEEIPAFLPAREDQQPTCPPGFEFDVINREVLISRAAAKGGRLVLPDGMSYRYLVLPYSYDRSPWSRKPKPPFTEAAQARLSADTLAKINKLAEAGVPVVGPKIYSQLVPRLRAGALAEVIKDDRLAADLEFRKISGKQAKLGWIHRRDGVRDIYFLSNQSPEEVTAEVAFRVAGKQPELWDAVSGKTRELPEYASTADQCTVVPMTFAARQSWFVVFQNAKGENPTARAKNFPPLQLVFDLSGPWEVQFDPKWFYPDNGTGGKVRLEALEDWSKHSADAIRHYSGIAVYRKRFDAVASVCARRLRLGEVHNLARVRLNGKELGIVWTAPWEVEIPAGLLKPKGNELEIEVANLWPNRMIGDGMLPDEKRRTKTNIMTYQPQLSEQVSGTLKWSRKQCPYCTERLKTKGPPRLLSSGLLGPVQVIGSYEESNFL
jgi:hypothetical protein